MKKGLGTRLTELIERHSVLPEEEKRFAERLFESGIDIAENRIRRRHQTEFQESERINKEVREASR